MVERKRTTSPVEADQNNPTKKSRTAAKPKKDSKDVGTYSRNKKQIGDFDREALILEKYQLNRTALSLDMDMKSFRTFFLENNKLRRQPRPIPAEFDDTSPVVVVGFNNDQAGEVLVVSKVRGGNRFTTVDLQAMCVVFYPNRGKAKIWLTI